MQKIPVFVINLQRRPDRLARVQAEFERVGVNFERVQGIDAMAKDPTSTSDWNGGLKFRPRVASGQSSYCCLLSHLSVLRRIVDEGISLAMVCEDDVRLSADILHLLSLGDCLPDELGLLQCEYHYGGGSVRKRLGEVLGHPVRDRSIHRLHSRTMGCACYLIRNRAAKLIVQNTDDRGFEMPIDVLLFDPYLSPLFNRLGVGVLVPAVAEQLKGVDSDIKFERKMSGKPIMGSSLFNFVWKIRNAMAIIRAILSGARYRRIGFR